MSIITRNSKSIPHRISYYTKKVAEYGSIHPAKPKPRAYSYRHGRLMVYKKLLHKQIAQQEECFGSGRRDVTGYQKCR
jgi:hypothetical protein